MRVSVLGSGSSGNAVAVQAENGTLLIDAGFGLRSLENRSKKIGVSLSSVKAILLTHEHGDHSAGVPALVRKVGCPVYGSSGTLRALARRNGTIRTMKIGTEEPTIVCDLIVNACHTNHDALEPLALTIQDPATGLKLGLAYDVGCPSPHLTELLGGCHCLMIEANHDESMLRYGPYPAPVRQRIAGPSGHLSNRAAAGMLRNLVHEDLGTVVLVHLSRRCNRPDLARDEVRTALDAFGFRGNLLVARQSEPLQPFEVRPVREQLSFEMYS